jgi:uncharacterized RDD family membrane protein YckC
MQAQGQYQDQYQSQFQAASALRYVGVGRRLFALIIDGVILGVIEVALGYAFGGAHMADGNVSISLTGLPAVIIGLVPILYFVVLEAVMGGTLGKLLLGMHITKLDGSRIGLGSSIVRNLLRVIDILPVAYILGAILIWTSPSKQRLGDRVAHTVVVRR